MSTDEITIRLSSIEKELSQLKKKKKKLKKESTSLTKKLMNNPDLSVRERFKIWADSPTCGDGNGDTWYPFNTYCPKTLNYISDTSSLTRHREYYVFELVDFEWLLYPEDYDDDFIPEMGEEFLLEMAEELMKANLITFIYDW